MRGFKIFFLFLIIGILTDGWANNKNKNLSRVHPEIKEILYLGNDNYNIRILLKNTDSLFLIKEDMEFNVYVQAEIVGQWIPVKIVSNKTSLNGLQKEIFIAVHIPIEEIKGIYRNFEGDISMMLTYKIIKTKAINKINSGEILIWLKPGTDIWVQREGM